MTDIGVPGFRSLRIRPTETGASAFGRTKVNGSLYFFSFEFVRREDGSPRERLLSRRIDTFCGKPVRSKVGPRLEDMADAASAAIVAMLASPPPQDRPAEPSAT